MTRQRQRTVSRRRVLQAIAVGSVVGSTALTASSPVTADHDGALPSHVTLSFPRNEMERYRPLLTIPESAEFKTPTWYGWRAASPEHELDVYVYFAYYRGQTGWTRSDSHRGDREPFYCFVDPDHQEVRYVAYSGWHWMRAASWGPNIYSGDGGHHPTARVFAKHHHYALTQMDSGQLFDVDPLGTDSDAPFTADAESDVQFEAWLADGWENALHPGAAQNPWVMRNRSSWWRDGAESWPRTIWNLQIQLAGVPFAGGFAGDATTSDLAD